MKTKIVLLTLALAGSTCLVTAQDNQRPERQRPPSREGGPGGPGAQGMRPGFHLLPPPVLDRLDLTADQQKQLADLETEVKTKLEKILTAEQLDQLKQMRPPQGGPGMRGGARPGGPGGYGAPNRPPGPSGQGRPPVVPPEQ